MSGGGECSKDENGAYPEKETERKLGTDLNLRRNLPEIQVSPPVCGAFMARFPENV
jgi:hypothetical protein